MNAWWLAMATASPPGRFEQEELWRMGGYPDLEPELSRRTQAVFRSTGVGTRAMWFEPEHRPSLDPDDFDRRYLEGARALSLQSAHLALERAGISAEEIDFLVFVSCTGFSCPGLSSELAYKLGIGQDRPTANLLGMGCSALIPGLSRAADFVRSHPEARALVVATEICSATYWIDQELETAVGNALFADGSAALVVSSCEGDLRRGSGPVARIGRFFTRRDGRYLGDMGFTKKSGRLRVRLARDVPEHILPLALEVFSALELSPGARVAFHPGGRKILDALEQQLERRAQPFRDAIGWSRAVLREHGNMSSPTVGFVVEKSFSERPCRQREEGAMISMGPGLSAEGVGLEWSPRR
ncbi:MAG: type III polyketide synthase [Bdellovibrionota bacterium]